MIELEANILNAICSKEEYLDLAVHELKKEYFSDPLAKEVFEIIKAMYRQDKPVTLQSVFAEAQPILNGRRASWLYIKEAFIAGSDYKFYCNELIDNYRKRQLQEIALNVSRMITDQEVDKVIKYTQDAVIAITNEIHAAPIISPKKHAERILDTLSRRMEKKSSGGIKTSYFKLNKVTNGGFQPGELVIIAAQTGRGKTAFALNLSRDIAIVQKQELLYINTEMNDDQIDTRLATIITKDFSDITYTKLATGDITDNQFQQVANALDRMHSSGFHSVTITDLTIDDVFAVARRFKTQKNIKVLIVDYVGRMETSDVKLQEWQVFKVIAKRLKTLAQQLNITVIMLAQLNEDERLEGARGMKNEADLMAYLREMTLEEQLEYAKRYNYFLVIDKNRNGPKGMIALNFDGTKMYFKGEDVDENARVGTVEQEQGSNRKSYDRKRKSYRQSD